MIYRHLTLFAVRGLLPAFLLLFFSVHNSCTQKKNESAVQDSVSSKDNNRPIPVSHARGFGLEAKNGYYLLHIHQDGSDAAPTQTYLLTENDRPLPDDTDGYEIIHIPVKKVVLLQTAYVAYFSFCNAAGAIAGIANAKYVFDKKVEEAVRQGRIREMGPPEHLNVELVTRLNPDLVIGSGFPSSPNKDALQLGRMDIPVLLLTDWLEADPLGRAEWVKLIGFLTGSGNLAIEKFKNIESEYLQLKKKTIFADARPLIICNLPYKGTWYMPGGKSYIARLLEDAGGHYGWSGDQHTGGIQVDFESVFVKGLEADVWINPGRASSVKDITGIDSRLSGFRPLKTGRVYNRNKRINPNGANDYWESGLVSPQLLLADMIKILHPAILPEHELFYYKKLR